MKSYRHLNAAVLALAFAAAIPCFVPSLAHAQSMAERLKAKAKARADAAADKGMDKGLDGVENAVKCASTDATCIQKAKADGKPVTVTNAKGDKVSSADSAKAVSAADAKQSSVGASASSTQPASAGQMDDVNVNFDFIPGDKVIFYEDFVTDKVGDLPARLDIREGNFTIVDKGGRHALMTASGGFVAVKLPAVLPDRYTIEVEYRLAIETNSIKWSLDDNNVVTLGCGHEKAYLSYYAGDDSKESSESSKTEPQIALCRFMVDKGYAKAYFGGMRTAQLNGLPNVRTKTLRFEVPGTDPADPFMLYSIRIAAGGKPLWDAISASGRVAVSGILFDTGSDHIRAESTPVLKEIGSMMRDHAASKLLVEGHTDNVGAAAANLSLSDRRAAAVKTWLVSKESVDASRLTTKGMGDTKPAVPNTTPEGRQNNRRVELVKQP